MIADFIESNIAGYGPELLTGENSAYLERFWLPFDRLTKVWEPLLSGVFDRSSGRIRVKPGRCVDIRIGGYLFEEDDFAEFSERGAALRARSFSVIEDVNRHCFESRSFFRFTFPIDISWRELAHAAPISYDVFQRPIRCFFVICDNGRVGKYADNDEDRPFHIYFESHKS